jgi:hypothetical protein
MQERGRHDSKEIVVGERDFSGAPALLGMEVSF